MIIYIENSPQLTQCGQVQQQGQDSKTRTWPGSVIHDYKVLLGLKIVVNGKMGMLLIMTVIHEEGRDRLSASFHKNRKPLRGKSHTPQNLGMGNKQEKTASQHKCLQCLGNLGCPCWKLKPLQSLSSKLIYKIINYYDYLKRC